jgi:hypothetical protein
MTIDLKSQDAQSQAQAIFAGLLQGLTAAAPVVAAANPDVALALGLTQALAPAVQMAIMLQQGGMLTAQLIKDMGANVTAAHASWASSVAVHPGI